MQKNNIMDKIGYVLIGLFKLHKVIKFVWTSYKNSIEVEVETEERFVGEDEEAHEIKGTPFTIARHKTEWYVLIGKYRITEGFATKEEAIEDSKRTDWERHLQIIDVVLKNNKKQ